ncbi:Hsp20/alpha crystallin family protein [Inmirania thermothiophila]|uniref:Hsp20/alpha crystallin family protein n=1 Tax=Inmirania thermothiophila TaxID=1750597 RepID=A0A3N1XZP8_9GAMM|nr:Hsp20/alpha crystallin family protein [Inmirania thermothiophila]ROR32066.1 Hsp20/alpha crystallin family protein [Inmirania thermothiophila]
MTGRDLESWMWQEALAMLARAERLHRRFFEPAADAAWEPPVDVYETPEAVWIVAALPGVPAERVRLRHEPGVAVIEGERRLPADARSGFIRRLEIPHGRFRRRIELPAGLALDGHQLVDGCLYIRFRKGA